MGKALATLNKAWEVHKERNPNADYFSFISGWDAAAYDFIPGDEPVHGDSTPVNAEPVGALPAMLRSAADVYLEWPDGTEAVDSDGDTYTRVDGHWEWTVYDDGMPRDTYGDDDGNYLCGWLPARVTRVGKS